MQREGIQRRSVVGKNSMPGDLPYLRDQIESGSRESRHVQRLANRANAFRSAAMLVDEHAATREIEQRNAGQYGQRAFAGNELKKVHLSKVAHASVAAWTDPRASWLLILPLKPILDPATVLT